MLRRILFSARWSAAGILCLLLWASPDLALGATLVQQIGELSGDIAERIVSDPDVDVVPFTRTIDPGTTPIIVGEAASLAPLRSRTGGVRRPARVRRLANVEQRAIREAYEAGQSIVILEASVHEVEELHELLEEGVAHESTTDPILIAYVLRQEQGIPTARAVTGLPPDIVSLGDEGSDEDATETDELALSQAIEIVLDELTRPPNMAVGGVGAFSSDDSPTLAVGGAGDVDWKNFPVQKTVLTATSKGTYNTPVAVYALHECGGMDHYLVETGGSWTAEDATFESASNAQRTFLIDPQPIIGGPAPDAELTVLWQKGRAPQGKENCTGGPNATALDIMVCRYIDYPLYYQVNMTPERGPKVIQLNSAPAATQGKSSTHQSGFSFSIGGSVNISGGGPGFGIQGGATWNNSSSKTVPPLLIEAGNLGNQGTFTRYRYCTIGDSAADCESTIQMVSDSKDPLCKKWIVGQPQDGQMRTGRLSDVSQTVHWQVDPTTYDGDKDTFDITVEWQTVLANSTVRLWRGGDSNCNDSGCSCQIKHGKQPVSRTYTFEVPIPQQTCE